MKTISGGDMARIRTIKPTFWTDEDMAEISESACLLAIGLLNYADDEGYFNANPKLIKAAVFPIRETSRSIPVLLHELSNCGYISLFSTQNGKHFGLINNFTKHQVVNKKTPSKIKEMNLLPYDYGSDTVGLPLGKEGKGSIKTTLCNTREGNLPDVDNAILNDRVPAGGFSVDGKFVMFDEWEPDSDFLRKSAFWGHALTDPVKPTELAEFITYWKAEGKAKHHEQWEMALAKSIKFQRAKANNSNTGVNNNGKSEFKFDPNSGKSRAVQLVEHKIREKHGQEYLDSLATNDGVLWGEMDKQERDGTLIDVETSTQRIE